MGFHSSNLDQTLGDYLAAVVEDVKKALGGGGVLIIVPPGSARGEVAKWLVHEGVVNDVLLYEERHKGVRVGRPLQVVGRQFYVGEKPLLQYLKGGMTLGSALKQKRIVIVPRSTLEALLIYKALLEALEKEKTWTPEGVEKLVKVYFLPSLYKEDDKEVAELARVDYGDVLKGIVENAKGISPSLARLARQAKAKSRLEELQQRVELLRSLSAEGAAPSLLSIVKEAAADAAKSAGLSLVPVIVDRVALSHVLSTFASPLETLASQFFGGLIEGFLDRAISRLKKRKNDVLTAIIELAKRAREAKPLVEEAITAEGGAAGLETLVDLAAASWGLTIQEYGTVVYNLATLLEDKLATHRDVNKAIEEFSKVMEARLAVLVSRVEKLEKWREEQEAKELSNVKRANVASMPKDQMKEKSPRRDRQRRSWLAA